MMQSSKKYKQGLIREYPLFEGTIIDSYTRSTFSGRTKYAGLGSMGKQTWHGNIVINPKDRGQFSR